MSAYPPDDRHQLISPLSTPREGAFSPKRTRRGSGTAALSSQPIDEVEEGDIADTFTPRRSSNGLGIAGTPLPVVGKRPSVQSLSRVPARTSPRSPRAGDNSRSPTSAATTPGLSRPLLSPMSSHEAFARHDTRYGGPAHGQDERGHRKNPSLSSMDEEDHYNPYANVGDSVQLRAQHSPSVRSAYEAEFHPAHECQTTKSFYQGGSNFLSISILLLSVYSTALSIIFVVIAVVGPNYGHRIRKGGSLTPAGANVLTSVLAKTIELSFVTAFVACLGQVLSRRAFIKEQNRGVSLAEMNMRSWITQPGTLITHFESVRYAGTSVLGILCLVATLVAMLYTSAATALVQPSLKFGEWENYPMSANVWTQFANTNYIAEKCPTPISKEMDKEEAGGTCLQIKHAAQAYHNYQQYLKSWQTVAAQGNGSDDQRLRPQGFALLNENTTITPEWIEIHNVTELSAQFGDRIINNVSMAMPHPGVFKASIEPRNNILQPEDLDGLGIYSLHASAPSPVINVLCANMNKEELQPLVYQEWPLVNEPFTELDPPWPDNKAADHQNKTVVDDIFGWDATGPKGSQRPPVFPKLPLPFNTVVNNTWKEWGAQSVYLLGRDGVSKETETYFLCSLTASLTPNCSTRYNATSSGATMEALCERPEYADLTFGAVDPLAPSGAITIQKDWPNVAALWINSIALNTGTFDGNGSNARLLTELTLHSPTLNKALPSPAEALAVLGGCTLLISAEDSPFISSWNYTAARLTEPTTQHFNARLFATSYASGKPSTNSELYAPFLLVLLVLALLNICALGYFIRNRGLVTDFSEGPNLFAVAVNSPPAPALRGACGGGPEGRMWNVGWRLGVEGRHLFFEAKPAGEKRYVDAMMADGGGDGLIVDDGGAEMGQVKKSGSPGFLAGKFSGMLAKRRRAREEVEEEHPVDRRYRQLANRRSWL